MKKLYAFQIATCVSCGVLPCSSYSCCCFYSPFSIVITSLGKRELVYVLLVQLFVYTAFVSCCPFSLPLRVRDCLRLVIVALPGLFY